ncbi:MAG: ATP-dependent DNA ligase [Actinobacteria bacterium]|nr:ATP-dependent DNA ligase [Actinomycetota bacterium]
MELPVPPPVAPMLTKPAKDLPVGDGFAYEPKWDGFRCIVFRSGDEVVLGSRNERPLTRYFPELAEPIRQQLPDKVVIDGEIVIATREGLDFDALQLRLHPAESRVLKLASETPASFVAFDLLALGDADARPLPLAERWRILTEVMGEVDPPLYLTPSTRDPAVARDWFARFEGAGLDGVVAKRLDQPYRENERVHVKVKHDRTADCVVAGFRWHKSGGVVGSLLLGLFDESSTLHHVGVIGAFPMAVRRSLVEELAPLREHALEGHPWRHWAEAAAHADAGQRLPGATSRWNAGKDLSWEPLRPERVVEVAYDQLQGDRFRHAAQFRRWRPDRDPSSCTYSQLETVVPAELAAVFVAAAERPGRG